jgi:hypothetical protein
VLRIIPSRAAALQEAVLTDITDVGESTAQFTDVRPMMVQFLLRHAMAEVISEGIINSLIVTNSAEANFEFTRVHECLLTRTFPSHPLKHSSDVTSPSKPTMVIFYYPSILPFGRKLVSFLGDVTAAAVWRRHTLSVAVEYLPREMMRVIFEEKMPLLAALLPDSADDPLGTRSVLEDAFKFSCVLRGAPADADPNTDALYRSFVPDLASTLDPDLMELVGRCHRSERGEVDRVGVTIFPGLVKILPTPSIETVVRRAQVVCECELLATSDPVSAPPPPPTM